MLVVKDRLLTALAGPTALDVSVHQVTIVTRTWLGGAIDADVASGPQYTDSVLPIPQKYQVAQLSTAEVEGSGGRYEVGDLIVKRIVPADPANPGVGFYPTQLAPVVTVPGQEVFYLVAGPHNGTYALRELRSFGILSYDLILARRTDTPVVVQPDASAGETE